MTADTLVFFVNGNKIEDKNVDPDYTLLRYLREKLQLPGTKLGCAEGGCGACTVMVSKYEAETDHIEHIAVNACLCPIGSVHGLAVTTVEGIGSTKTRLHPVQERLAKSHGSQCGFCTPGFVMSMYTLLRNNPQPSMTETEDSLVGNLCRCTGYRPILEGFRTFVEDDGQDVAEYGCGREDCCKLQKNNNICNGILNGDADGSDVIESTTVLFDSKQFKPYDPTQEIIFPPELKTRYKYLANKSVVFRGPLTTLYRPTTLSEMLKLKKDFPQAKIVVGNTEVGVEVKYKNQEYPVIINPMNIPEILATNITSSEVEIGAAITLTNIEILFRKLVAELPDYKTQVLRSVLEMLRWFAGRQIRNVAALGGNIMTGSPISDLNPVFMASGSKLKFMSVDGERLIPMDDKFYTSYRRNRARPDEVLISVRVPLVTESEYVMAYKQSRRRDDDIAIVNATMNLRLKPNSLVVDSLSMAFGGMAPTTIMAKETMKILIGRIWDASLLEDATSSLLEELNLHPSAPGGMVEYRLALCASFFLKFYFYVRQEVRTRCPQLLSVGPEEEEKFAPYQSRPTTSTQFFQNVPVGQDRIDPVGRPVPHAASMQQTTGEATYLDDIPTLRNELYAAFVTSSRCHARVLSIDPSEALGKEGVEAFFCAKDLSESQNKTGAIVLDEEVFASTEVKCVGQILGILVAKDQLTVQRAAKKVKIQYEDLPNSIITIQDAIKAQSFWDPIILKSGNVEEGFRSSDHVLEGESYIGGQEHFYLETHATIAIPHENGEMEIISSSQSPTTTQNLVAKALGVPANRVTSRVKRMGGGFGAKETRASILSVPVAVAASKLGRPVRIMLDRDEDMQISGARHSFYAVWKVGFNSNGTVVAIEENLYSNAGYSLDLSVPVMERALLSADNAYNIKNLKITGRCCRTNIPSNTAFRGFGGPQGIFVTEDILSKVADYLKMDSKLVRERNFYTEHGDVTPYGQVLNDCHVRKCWDQVIIQSDYERRKQGVEEYNRKHKYRKRGLSIMPTKFCISFSVLFLNQSGALVHVYTDGSVLVSHGGTEMGQGLHTKMIQVASRALQVPAEKIYISETSTDKVPNTSATAASSGSDLNGMAVLEACEKLARRLAPYRKKNPDGQWEDWVQSAYVDRVSLSATGYYKTPDISQYSFTSNSGTPFSYFCFGAAVSEVEIDCLTGDHTVLRTDIVMDVGTSLNPAIDIGQVEGAFTQGMGLFTLEELRFSPDGVLLTRGPGAYKLPSVQDIPREFNVALLRDSSNPRAVYSSKAVGEPPLFLAATVFHAIRDAIKEARGCDGRLEAVQLYSPATAERIRMACKDHITEKIKPAKEGTYTPWSVAI